MNWLFNSFERARSFGRLCSDSFTVSPQGDRWSVTIDGKIKDAPEVIYTLYYRPEYDKEGVYFQGTAGTLDYSSGEDDWEDD